MEIQGRALKYGDNINTDIISPPQYMELSIAEAAEYAMSSVDPEFVKKIKDSKIFVAENNLGSGSSRETAPLTLKHLGVKVIIAKSFARIFYRNCINLGIPVIECGQTEKIQEGDELKVDIEKGIITDTTRDITLESSVIPPHVLNMIKEGGLVSSLRKRFGKE